MKAKVALALPRLLLARFPQWHRRRWPNEVRPVRAPASQPLELLRLGYNLLDGQTTVVRPLLYFFRISASLQKSHL